jgi:hypothetical protein
MRNDGKELLIQEIVRTVQTVECLSPLELYDLGFGILDPAESEALRLDIADCAGCRERLNSAEGWARQEMQKDLASVNRPAQPLPLPATISEILNFPGDQSTTTWASWQAKIVCLVRPAPAGRSLLLGAARGAPSDLVQRYADKQAIGTEIPGGLLRVAVLETPAASCDLWVELLDQLLEPVPGKQLQLLSEGAVTPESRTTSVRGVAIFSGRKKGNCLLRVDDSVVRIEIDGN